MRIFRKSKKEVFNSVLRKIGKLKFLGVKFILGMLYKSVLLVDEIIGDKLGSKKKFLYAVLIGMLFIYQAPGVIWHLKGSTVTFVMEGRERIPTQDGSEKYEIYTSKGIFHNETSILRLKKSASKLQESLKFGGVYECKVQGYRSVYLKRYQNLIRCKEVTKQP